jgi:hypothetical protein
MPMLTTQEMELLNEVAVHTLKIARPLIWHDVHEPWPKRLCGGTCFILRFDLGLVGITANHVIEVFEEERTRSAGIVSFLRTVPIDLTGTIIDRDRNLDIATFSVTERQLIGSEAIPIDCRGQGWPPPMPDPGRELSFAGYPNALKKTMAHDEIKFEAFVSLTRAEDTTLQDIVAIFDPTRDIRALAAPEFPDIGINLSGCSGGPVLMHTERRGLHRWFPVALILQGPRATLDGPPRSYDTFRFRRLDFVNADGSIRHRPDVGWLPNR